MASTLLSPPSGVPLERLVQVAVDRGYTAQGEMFSGELAEGRLHVPWFFPGMGLERPGGALLACQGVSFSKSVPYHCLLGQGGHLVKSGARLPGLCHFLTMAVDKQLTPSVPHFLRCIKGRLGIVRFGNVDPAWPLE